MVCKMFMSLKFMKNKLLKWFYDNGHYISLTLLIVPISYFEIFIVLPTILELWSFSFICHLGCANFFIFNVIGNIIYGMYTYTTIKCMNLEGFNNKKEWTFCTVCECLRPPRSWHCNTCEICILKRDHHCRFLACCVGYFNHRYFMCLMFYSSMGLLYFLYLNIRYVSLFLTWNRMLILKLICPFGGLVLDYGSESWYAFLLVLNLLSGLTTGCLFNFHMGNLLNGKITSETRSESNDYDYDQGWKLNLIEVFGSRWYLTWISPFIHSKLPGNGVEWTVDQKIKIC
ncbi:hypothetical protein PYW08_000957 [Mythimna loreyi]|uniref:Uncharacterized protein n=1 Tax=Mythimna loreyi TaxID=667449 RepID=A0ACC2QZL7_9NEOP|nr:hypothetical protein PYW08_000957 [Mythimna loreyi]